MKAAYPVVFTRLDDGYMAYVSDFVANTQGDTMAEAIEMARDVIGLMGIDMEHDKKAIPVPSAIEAVAHDEGEVVSLVDVDFAKYRRENDNRTVRRNVTLPYWLNERAAQAGINVSAVLRDALKTTLGVQG